MAEARAINNNVFYILVRSGFETLSVPPGRGDLMPQ